MSLTSRTLILLRFLPFFLMLVLVLGLGRAIEAASTSEHATDGTYRGRVLTELALHRQFVQQRVQRGFVPQALPSAPAVDVGDVAVLPDDGTLVIPVNFFDLDHRTLTFQPAIAGFTVSAGPLIFDSEAAANGFLLNPLSNPGNIGDDGTREVSLGFSFSYFGQSYTQVFINSDGNLTFQAGDTAISPRSLARFLTGPPRIAPYFADLDPSAGGQLTYFSSSSRFVVTWSAVPDFAQSGVGLQETFQVILTPDGRIQFSYNGINGRETVVGVSPGNFSGLPNLLDLSGTAGNSAVTGPIAEVFTASTQLDLPAVAQHFYQTHEDAYDFLIVFTNFDFSLGRAFAYEVNIANDVRGIGNISEPAVFDFSKQFGSSRLQSLVNMGNLLRYPSDPFTVFLGENSTLSILGQEAGHRFLVYVTFNDPEGSPNSTALLGRDFQHWSFLLNSDASVLEGNRIQDNGSGTFTTIGAVEHYNEIDQYLMGLRSPGEVSSTFLVKPTTIPIDPARAPQRGVSFPGRRANITLDQIIQANGPRAPNSVIAPKRFNFAFVLVTPRNNSPDSSQVAHLDTIRREWEPYFAQATSFRGTAQVKLVRGLRFVPSPLGLFSGTRWQASVELLAPATANVSVTLTNSNPAAVSVPSQVVIPAGANSAVVPVTALNPGRALVTVTAPGFETQTIVIETFASPSVPALSLLVMNGDHQIGKPGELLPQPLQVILRDSNQIPVAGARVEFAVTEGDVSLNPSGIETDGQGKAATMATLGVATGSVTIVATVPGTSLRAQFMLASLGTAQVSQAGVVNAASYGQAPAPLVPGSIVSIFGMNLSAFSVLAESFPLPTHLSNTSVEIGGIPAPLFYVSPLQINAQVPIGITGPTASLIVRNGTSSSELISLSVSTVGPGIFSQNWSGTGPGIITHPGSELLVSTVSPARIGDFVQIYATGLGPVEPGVSNGQPAPLQPLSRMIMPVEVLMNGIPAPHTDFDFAGLAPTQVGVYQVNARVPEGVSGTVSVVLRVNGISSNSVTLNVQ
ncbi:MAG: hypothetical protein HY313_10995 [Acidobacteria bacterium]|nr:hypothetical protein [Acidobacteriota bacterium]